MKLIWHQAAWDEYLAWQETDRKIVRRINLLIRDIARGGDGGLGKPELLRGDLSGWASRRIDGEHRLVYRETGGDIVIALAAGITSEPGSYTRQLHGTGVSRSAVG